MEDSMIKICAQSFDINQTHFSFELYYENIEDMSELNKLQQFSNLTSASFDNTNLDRIGLRSICKNTSIENLNLQNTKISDNDIFFLKYLPNLKYLRLKENWQLTDKCIKYINKLENLVDLQIHETSISQNGVRFLNLPNLEYLMVSNHENKIAYEPLTALSVNLPNCHILVKGKAEFHNGKILWSKP